MKRVPQDPLQDTPSRPCEAAEIGRELECLYRELEAEIAGLGVCCWARGDCCDFRLAEHVLYASSLELAYVLERHPGPFPGEARLCPFWVERRCTERGRRPLGCRTYFCDRRYRDALQSLHEKYHRRIQALAGHRQIPWHYVRFVEALRSLRRHP